MTEFKYPPAVYDVIAEFVDEEQLAMALIIARKNLDRAIWWLNEIVENHRFTPISTAEKALKELKEQQ